MQKVTQRDTAEYIGAMLSHLVRMASENRFPALGYLLELAREEAMTLASNLAPPNTKE